MKKQPVLHHNICEYAGFTSSHCRKTTFNQWTTIRFYYSRPVITVFFTKVEVYYCFMLWVVLFPMFFFRYLLF